MKTKKLFLTTLLVVIGAVNENFAQTWSTTGNSGTNPSTNFIGTTDPQDLIFKRGNTFSGKIGYYGTAFGLNSLTFSLPNSNNTAFGTNNLNSNSLTGGGNIAIGNSILVNNTTGSGNIGLGAYSLYNNTVGYLNIGIGEETLRDNSTGSHNNAVGKTALMFNTTGGANDAFGTASLYSNTIGNYNSAFGHQSLLNNISGNYNSVIGNTSLFNNTIGSNNSAQGHESLYYNTSGNSNSALGIKSLYYNVSGSSNIAIGEKAGYYLTAGNNNIFIGKDTYSNVSNTSSNQLNIGNVITGIDMGSNSVGKIGIGLAQGASPGNKLEIKHGTANNSGLRFTNLNSSYTPTTTASKFLTVDANGDVILQNVLASGTTIIAGQNIVVTGNPTTGYTVSSPTTNTLVNDGVNRMTSTVNGVLSKDRIVNTVQNTIAFGQLTTTVNGVSSSPVVLPATFDSDAQTLSITGNQLTISNGNTVTLPTSGSGADTSIYNSSLSIVPADFGNRVVTLNDNNLVFNTSGSNEDRNKVYIGENPSFPMTTGNYKLYVEGGVLTEKVKVALRSTANWADYVFANDYKLMPLNEVETFVKSNKHLPGISSADKLVNEGLDLGEMQAKQMEKIEELTLYAIEQNKKIEKQGKEIEKQGKEIEELKVLVKTLMDKK